MLRIKSIIRSRCLFICSIFFRCSGFRFFFVLRLRLRIFLSVAQHRGDLICISLCFCCLIYPQIKLGFVLYILCIGCRCLYQLTLFIVKLNLDIDVFQIKTGIVRDCCLKRRIQSGSCLSLCFRFAFTLIFNLVFFSLDTGKLDICSFLQAPCGELQLVNFLLCFGILDLYAVVTAVQVIDRLDSLAIAL